MQSVYWKSLSSNQMIAIVKDRVIRDAIVMIDATITKIIEEPVGMAPNGIVIAIVFVKVVNAMTEKNVIESTHRPTMVPNIAQHRDIMIPTVTTPSISSTTSS